MKELTEKDKAVFADIYEERRKAIDVLVDRVREALDARALDHYALEPDGTMKQTLHWGPDKDLYVWHSAEACDGYCLRCEEDAGSIHTYEKVQRSQEYIRFKGCGCPYF